MKIQIEGKSKENGKKISNAKLIRINLRKFKLISTSDFRAQKLANYK